MSTAFDNSVLVVLTNYRRPDMVEEAAVALAKQSHRSDIVIVDNHGESPQFAISDKTRDLAIDVWSFSANHGPPCRFAAAFLPHTYKYVYFHDEDMLPGTRAIEWLLSQASRLNDKFATLSECGRLFKLRSSSNTLDRNSWNYDRSGIKRTSNGTYVDITVRAHLVQTKHMQFALSLKWDIISKHGIGVIQRAGLHRHDDMLLSLGIQRACGYSSRLTSPSSADTSIRKHEQPVSEHDASIRRSSHAAERTELIRCAYDVGWTRKW